MLQKCKPLNRLFSFLTLIIVISGCQNFYKISNRKITDKANTVDSLKHQMRYFVLRTPSQAWYMKNTVVSADRNSLSATLDTLPIKHMVHLDEGKGKMRYKSAAAGVLNEVHFFISDDTQLNVGSYSLTLDKIQKIEVIEKDKKKTTNSYVIGTLGYTLGTVALAVVIVAATKSSCPFVSAYDGNQFALQGEIYGGSIYPQLVRHDYLPLKMSTASNGNLQIKISNELQERQFTDMAELMVIKHNKNTKVLSDDAGKLYNIQKPEAPVTAVLSNKKDVKEYLLFADQKLLYFDDSSSASGNNHVVLRFDNKEAVKKGKLILSLKNSYWLDYLYGEFAKGFGNYFNTYTKQQLKKTAEQLTKVTKDQQVPLEVSIKTKGGWTKVTDITTVGPVAVRSMVIPVDLSLLEDSNIEIKLSSGYLFWELDYAAIDFSNDDNLDVNILKPSTAYDETGKDVLQVLSREDNQFLKQPLPGTVTTIDYKWNPSNNSNEAYTFILHTKGYYEHVRNFKGAPNTKFLEQFKKPGAFPQYSLQRFKQFNEEQVELLSKK